MTLAEYTTRITEITTADLPPAEKRAALELVAQEIRSAAWQAPYRAEAAALAAHALRTAAAYPDSDEDGLKGLAAKGLLRPKSR